MVSRGLGGRDPASGSSAPLSRRIQTPKLPRDGKPFYPPQALTQQARDAHHTAGAGHLRAAAAARDTARDKNDGGLQEIDEAGISSAQSSTYVAAASSELSNLRRVTCQPRTSTSTSAAFSAGRERR